MCFRVHQLLPGGSGLPLSWSHSLLGRWRPWRHHLPVSTEYTVLLLLRHNIRVHDVIIGQWVHCVHCVHCTCPDVFWGRILMNPIMISSMWCMHCWRFSRNSDEQIECLNTVISDSCTVGSIYSNSLIALRDALDERCGQCIHILHTLLPSLSLFLWSFVVRR